jgi:hypothetical protein
LIDKSPANGKGQKSKKQKKDMKDKLMQKIKQGIPEERVPHRIPPKKLFLLFEIVTLRTACFKRRRRGVKRRMMRAVGFWRSVRGILPSSDVLLSLLMKVQKCFSGESIKQGGKGFRAMAFRLSVSSGGRIRTSDLWVMSPTS